MHIKIDGRGASMTESPDGIMTCRVTGTPGWTSTGDCLCRVEIDLHDVARWMASNRHSPYWCRPAFGTAPGDVPTRTQCLLWSRTDGRFGAILPLCAGETVTMLEGHAGELSAVVQSFDDMTEAIDTVAFLAAEDDDPYCLLARLAAEAARVLGGKLKLRDARDYPAVFDYLGWCTWDAMEIWVNEAEIMQKCDEFAEKGIPVRWAILDDMWADVAWAKELPRLTPHHILFPAMHASKLRALEADPDRFPDGLRGCVEKLHARGMQVGVWHPITGYWAGIAPDSPAAATFADCTMVAETGRIVPDLRTPARAERFYDRFHAFLRDCGADFVKVDNQSCLPVQYKNTIPVGTAARNLHAGLEASVDRHFGGAMINCMGMGSENLFNRTASAVSRTSDDFQPENGAWFARHLMQCAYGGLVQGQFCVCDWDMWWTDDGQAGKNSLLRALSGGPIYVSDRLGRSRAELFAPLCFADGRILRPDGVAVPTREWLVADPTQTPAAMTVVNHAGETTYVAAFNLCETQSCVEGCIDLATLPLAPAELYLCYEHFSREWGVFPAGSFDEFTLERRDDYRLYSITPVRDGIAVIGDVRKFIGVRAIVEAAPGAIRTVEGGCIGIWRHDSPVTAAETPDGAPLTVTTDGHLAFIEAGEAREFRYR